MILVYIHIYIYIYAVLFYNYIYIYISDSVKFKETEVNTYTLNSLPCVGSVVGCKVCYRSDVKLGGFQAQLEASRMSSHTEEL